MTEVWSLGGPIAAPAATDRVPVATGTNAGGYIELGSLMHREATYGGYIMRGGHADAYGRLYSTGDGGTDDASLDCFASHPGVDYGGAGIGSNLDKHRVEGKRRSTRPAGCVEFDGATGDIIFFTATAGETTLVERLRVKASGHVIFSTGFSDYADDAAAAAGGVPIKGAYRTGSFMKYRVA